MPRYNPAVIEPKWQKYWEENKTFAAPELPTGEKFYALDMFPYPSGDGLHVGHPEGYTATDILCRFERMRGKSVLHPMGFDAFGLPAEEHAIKTNTPPRESTEKNIDTFRRQLKMLGFSYDWDRELATTDVDYFKWTQWIFTVMFDTWFDPDQQKGRPISELPIPAEISSQGEDTVGAYQDDHRLAFQSDALVNWCAGLGTVLANEEVIDGKSERGGHPVTRMPLRQWMLRITAYAERLQNDLETLDWSHSIKTMQREWIGRSTGVEVDFYIGDAQGYDQWKASRKSEGLPTTAGDDCLRVYTTRPDTLFGATYMVIAPEHPFVQKLTTADQSDSVTSYCEAAAAKSDRERQEDKKKTGVFTGSFAINPINGRQIPIWISDYVLITYGTGAIMAVPAHDERDFEFAKAFEIAIEPVVDPGDKDADFQNDVLAGDAVFSGNGTAVNSQQYNGLSTADFKEKIAADLAAAGIGKSAVNYKLRDWLFSRQRFWGEPFPILHEVDSDNNPTGAIRAVDAADLPVDLPHLEDYKPHGRPEPPLAKADDDWLYVELNGKRYRRETNTMPQWAGSCWYYLRFIDPKNDSAFVDPAKENAWMPIDLYVGGAEHAVLHLLYARFWHKVLYDRGYVSTIEPFQRLINQGMILGETEYTGYQTEDGAWVSVKNVKRDDDKNPIHKQSGDPVIAVSVEEENTNKKGDAFVLTADESIQLEARAYKMSKSRGNVVNPDDIVQDYGADTLRLYEMFMGPLEATKPWNMQGVGGVKNFLDRVWRMIIDFQADEIAFHDAVQEVEPTEEQNRVLHKTIKAVTEDLENMGFNTAIARMMEFVNFFTKQKVRPKSALRPFVLLLSPFAPHLAEELWQLLGADNTLAYEPWPKHDESFLKEDSIELPIQINGKVRHKINIATDAQKEAVEQLVRDDPKVQELIGDKSIAKLIVVPGRLVNLVIK